LTDSLRRNAHILVIAATILLVAAVGLLTWLQFTSTGEARFMVRHTNEVITTVDELRIAVRAAETAQRGYLLTGQPDYLTPYHDASLLAFELRDELFRLTDTNPVQQDRLTALAPLLQHRLEELAQTIGIRDDKGLGAALAVVPADLGQHLMGEIDAILTAMRAEEERLLDGRRRQGERAESVARLLAVGGSVLAVALLALGGHILTRSRNQLLASEAEQRAMLRQMRVAFDSVSQGIGAFSADGHLVRWNERFPALLGLPGAMMRPGTAYSALAELLAADGVSLLKTERQPPRRGDGPASGEPAVHEFTRATDGRSFEVRRTAMPVGGYVLTVTDTTERVRADAASRDAQRLQAMGQLTGGIAHDFNNLLTVVLGNLEMANALLEPNSPVLSRLDRAMWAAQRGASLTQQLLAFARRQPLAPMPINLSALLPDMAELLQRTLGEHIEVRVVDAVGLWTAMADPAQVESALLNLALNARDAMPGGGRLTIEVANKVLDRDYARRHAEVTPGDYVMLAVADTGTGMTPAVLARAFEPFFTTKEPGKGTGLGLAMVFGFAKQSGGHVNISSMPGEGTTVSLYLPRAIGIELPATPGAAMPAALPRGSATVLVVEDDDNVREVAVAILRDLGYQVLAAADGAEALRVADAAGAAIELLLVDVVLPGGMKGDEVARRLGAGRPGLRTLFMSGYTEDAALHQDRHDGSVQLIVKPFQQKQLARKVAAVLGMPRAEADAGRAAVQAPQPQHPAQAQHPAHAQHPAQAQHPA
jgi:signal transduction histidine kinase/CHASE3 domain sensor protein/DNA-binding NarL/FixJ family response regulator